MAFNFNIVVPKPFRLADQDPQALDKILDEAMDKVRTWEKRQSQFFDMYFKGTDSWRIKPFTQKQQKPKQLFNSKSGETHRGAETLATVWQRMLTAADPYFEALKMGLNPLGMEVTEEDIYATEGVLLKQQEVSQFKKKLLRICRSLANVGTVMVEQPFTSRPYGYGQKNIEYTDFQFRPMIRVGFDTAVSDIRESDYVFTIDFLSKWMLKNLASQDTEYWDRGKVDRHIADFGNGVPASASGVYNRIRESRARAGYNEADLNVFESIGYHGRINPENSAVYALCESLGPDVDPEFVDISVGILDAKDICKMHVTQYGDWRTKFVSATYKDFEDEPQGYGIFQIGRKLQREMDINESMTNDLLTAFTLMMFKIGKYSGYNEKQMVWEPLKTIELEDINQLAPLTPDPAAFKVALEMINLRREDFRNIIGAQTNLQAQYSKGISATEAGLSQTEAIRAASVHAEIIGETLIREHLEISHLNNLNYLDEPIWVGLTGTKKPMLINKDRLPINVGFKVKIVTDKDFRPEGIQKLLETIQICSSIRNEVPSSINALPHLFEELFRRLGMNPRLLREPIPLADQMATMLNKAIKSGAMPMQPGQGAPKEVAGEAAGAGGGVSMQGTPVGPVATSPLGANQVQTEASA